MADTIRRRFHKPDEILDDRLEPASNAFRRSLLRKYLPIGWHQKRAPRFHLPFSFDAGERRRNNTHQSTTDPKALLARKGKGKESKPSYAGHVLMENPHDLAVNGCVTQATGRAEPQAAVAMVEQVPGWRRITLGADKGVG